MRRSLSECFRVISSHRRCEMRKPYRQWSAKEDFAPFIGGQLEVTSGDGPITRGEISNIRVDRNRGLELSIMVELVWAVKSKGDIRDYKKKGWELDPECREIEIPLFTGPHGFPFIQEMDIGRILVITIPFPLSPKRHLFMASGCGTLEPP